MALDPIAQRHPAIFLSASIPIVDRAARYFDTCDVIAIRECVKALVGAVVPQRTLVWGGHPSITPLIRLLAEEYPEDIADRFVLYQSRRYEHIAPKDNEYFRYVRWVDSSENEKSSQELLRFRMITEPNYVAAVFIGGMDGIEIEFREFLKAHPHASVFPIASTGGAANILYQEWSKPLGLDPVLETETAYPFLFRKLLAPDNELRPSSY